MLALEDKASSNVRLKLALRNDDRIVFTDVVIDTVGQQTHLGSVRASMNRFMQSASRRGLLYFIRGWRVFTQPRPKAVTPGRRLSASIADIAAQTTVACAGSTSRPVVSVAGVAS